MPGDFTISIYKELFETLVDSGYHFQTFRDYMKKPEEKTILLRHDVDDRKHHSLKFAKVQYEKGVESTYYFRMIPQSFDAGVVREIADMGHEIGYHYEDMDFANGVPHRAIKLFEKHLSRLRNAADVKTICMHGSPLSKYDNRDLWNHYDYRDYGIIGEPYFDLDFTKVLYLTDTGRRWDGDRVSIRDKAPEVKGKAEFGSQNSGVAIQKNSRLLTHDYHSTVDIIDACKKGELPDQIMLNFHPQRWTDHPVLWMQELLMQNVKNVVKRGLKVLRMYN